MLKMCLNIYQSLMTVYMMRKNGRNMINMEKKIWVSGIDIIRTIIRMILIHRISFRHFLVKAFTIETSAALNVTGVLTISTFIK